MDERGSRVVAIKAGDRFLLLPPSPSLFFLHFLVFAIFTTEGQHRNREEGGKKAFSDYVFAR